MYYLLQAQTVGIRYFWEDKHFPSQFRNSCKLSLNSVTILRPTSTCLLTKIIRYGLYE